MIEMQESITAKLCAFVRAWHSNRARQKIYDDYLAYDMMGKADYEEMYDFIRRGFSENGAPFSPEDTEEIIKEYLAPIPLSRVHFAESRLGRFAEEHGKVQYIICGAGSDTYSFRCDNPDIEIFEIDHPATQRGKLRKIRRLEWNIPKNVHFVSVDFEKEQMNEKLLAAGFSTERKTFFSILGVSYYLTLPVFTATLSQIAELSSPDSVLVFDYPQSDGEFPQRVRRLAEITHSLGEEMRGGFTYPEISRALYSLGFQIDTYLNPSRVQEQYFTDRIDGLRAFENVNLLSAVYTGGRSFE